MKIAVYGTLRQGEGNHHRIESGKLLGTCLTPKGFTMFDNGGFPFVFPEGNGSIKIEVFEVTDEQVIRSIYRLEGYTGIRNHPNNWYDTVDVDTEFGTAIMFVSKARPQLPIIKSGDWKHK